MRGKLNGVVRSHTHTPSPVQIYIYICKYPSPQRSDRYAPERSPKGLSFFTVFRILVQGSFDPKAEYPSSKKFGSFLIRRIASLKDKILASLRRMIAILWLFQLLERSFGSRLKQQSKREGIAKLRRGTSLAAQLLKFLYINITPPFFSLAALPKTLLLFSILPCEATRFIYYYK